MKKLTKKELRVKKNSLSVIAIDFATNLAETYADFTVWIDTKKPLCDGYLIDPNIPGATKYINNPIIEVWVLSESGETDFLGCKLSNDGVSYSEDMPVSSPPCTALEYGCDFPLWNLTNESVGGEVESGYKTVSVICHDKVNNSDAECDILFDSLWYLDLDLPTVIINLPEEIQPHNFTNQTGLQISLELTDDESGLGGYEVWLGDNIKASKTYNDPQIFNDVVLQSIDLVDGENRICVNVSDFAGNQNGVCVNVTLDLSPPLPVALLSGDYYFNYTTNVSFSSGVVSENGQVECNAYYSDYSDEGGVIYSPWNAFNYEETSSQEFIFGDNEYLITNLQYEFYFTCVDLAGNSNSSDIITAFFDDLPPYWNFYCDENLTQGLNLIIIEGIAVSDNSFLWGGVDQLGSGLSNVYCCGNWTTNCDEEYNWLGTSTILGDIGEMTCTAFDKAGNSKSCTFNIV